MEQNLFTPEQKIIFDELSQNDFIKKNFYFTGGTALSIFYLGHRYSIDLDFFTAKKFDTLAIFNIFSDLKRKLNFEFTAFFPDPLYIIGVSFPNGQDLKVDFSHYRCQKVGQDLDYNGLKIDSELDIAVNKLLTINQRSDAKDFVDLYFLLQKLNRYTIWDLIEGVKVKFRFELELLPTAYDFLKVEKFEFLPKMIKPLELLDVNPPCA